VLEWKLSDHRGSDKRKSGAGCGALGVPLRLSASGERLTPRNEREANLAQNSAVRLDTELIKAPRTIRARKRKPKYSRSLNLSNVLADPFHIVLSIPYVLMEDWPSTIRATQRAESEQTEVKQDFDDGFEHFQGGHRMFLSAGGNG
jgi:hypothetical protein